MQLVGMARRPKKRSFFKRLVGDFSQCLRIPPEFIQNFNGRSIHKCTLRGPTGKRQDVELERRNNGLFLHEGWQNFVKEHHLEDGDLLILRFDGESKFKVTIYDTTACEKDAEVDEMRSSSSVSLASKGQARVKEETVDLETEEYNDICGKKRSNAGTHVTSGKRPEDDLAEATLNGSILFKSKHWFFTVTFKKYHRTCIYIPKKLAIAEGLMNKNCLMIQDPTGRSWLVHLRSRRNRSLYHVEMTSGLPKFCRANQIVPGDTLIFEFVKESAAKIHIFRKGYKVVLDVPEREAEKSETRCGSPFFPARGGLARVKEDLETEEYNKICEKRISNSGRSGIHITSGMRSEDDHAEATSNGSILFKSKKLYFTVTFKKYHQRCTYIPKKLAIAGGLMSKNCIMIQDPTGRSWLVKLGFRQSKSSGYVEMKTGLAECYRANHIVPGDTLIFEFVKESVAKMHIFRNGFKAVLDVPEDAEVAETRSISGISLASEGQARVQEETVDLETEEYNENFDKEATMYGKTDKCVSCGKRPADDHVEAPSVNGSLLFKSKNLCFTVASAKHHQYRIDIPKKLAIAQGLMSKNCLTIQDPTGRSWLVELMFCPNSDSQRVEMRTGLAEIFRANQIVPGDTLIFEFVKDNIAKVHILRKGNSVVLDVPDVGK